MIKLCKRILVVILALAMSLSVLDSVAFAEDVVSATDEEPVITAPEDSLNEDSFESAQDVPPDPEIPEEPEVSVEDPITNEDTPESPTPVEECPTPVEPEPSISDELQPSETEEPIAEEISNVISDEVLLDPVQDVLDDVIPYDLASYPSSLYMRQETSGTCTLYSATMMIRARAYLSGYLSWEDITAQSVRSVGWLEGAGLRWTWTYRFGSNSVSIGRTECSGLSSAELKALLDAHPEGIEIYDRGLPHAVWVLGYSGDVFYCADPANTYSGSRIRLANTWLGKNRGTQDDVLSNIGAYWYVRSYSIKPGLSTPSLTKVTSSESGVTIKWAGASGAEKYQVYRLAEGASKSTRLATVSGNSYVDTTAEPGILYTYKVRAYGTSNGTKIYSSFSDTITTMYLSTPTVTACKNTTTGIKIAWTQSYGADEYFVYRSINDGDYKRIASLSGTAKTYIDTTIGTSCVTCSYKVFARHTTSGGTIYKSAAGLGSIFYVAAPKITDVTPGTGAIAVVWSCDPSATGYQVQYATKSDFTDAKKITIRANGRIYTTISNLSSGTTYYVRMRTYFNDGSNHFSAWVKAPSVSVK